MIFPGIPLLLCIVGFVLSLASDHKPGMYLSAVAMIIVVVADAYLCQQRAKRPDFTPWDEI